MRRFLIVLGSALMIGEAAAAELPLSALLGNSSNLSPQYRALIRAPVPGSLQGQPRRPQKLQEDGWAIPSYTGSSGQYQEMARAAARRHSVPEDLFLRLVNAELKFRPKAVSSKGAIGLAQLMPGTARLLRVNPYDPRENLDGGARYLKMQYQKFGDWRLALAAYNAGPGAVEKYKGVPPYNETRNYVRNILGR